MVVMTKEHNVTVQFTSHSDHLISWRHARTGGLISTSATEYPEAVMLAADLPAVPQWQV